MFNISSGESKRNRHNESKTEAILSGKDQPNILLNVNEVPVEPKGCIYNFLK